MPKGLSFTSNWSCSVLISVMRVSLFWLTRSTSAFRIRRLLWASRRQSEICLCLVPFETRKFILQPARALLTFCRIVKKKEKMSHHGLQLQLQTLLFGPESGDLLLLPLSPPPQLLSLPTLPLLPPLALHLQLRRLKSKHRERGHRRLQSRRGQKPSSPTHLLPLKLSHPLLLPLPLHLSLHLQPPLLLQPPPVLLLPGLPLPPLLSLCLLPLSPLPLLPLRLLQSQSPFLQLGAASRKVLLQLVLEGHWERERGGESCEAETWGRLTL